MVLSFTIFLLHLFYDNFLNLIIGAVAALITYITLKLAYKFTPREKYGQVFLFAGIGFLLWSVSCFVYYFSSFWDNLLTFAGYVSMIIALVILHSISDQKAPRKKVVPYALAYIAFVLAIAYLSIVKLGKPWTIIPYYVFTSLIALYIAYLVVVYNVGKLSSGLRILLVSGFLISIFYLLKPIAYSKLLEIIRIFTWTLNLWAAIKISKDLYIPIFNHGIL